MKTQIFRIPAHYIAPLINDDYSALSEDEDRELTEWLSFTAPGHATAPDGEGFFSHWNDINNCGVDCYDVTFVQPE